MLAQLLCHLRRIASSYRCTLKRSCICIDIWTIARSSPRRDNRFHPPATSAYPSAPGFATAPNPGSTYGYDVSGPLHSVAGNRSRNPQVLGTPGGMAPGRTFPGDPGPYISNPPCFLWNTRHMRPPVATQPEGCTVDPTPARGRASRPPRRPRCAQVTDPIFRRGASDDTARTTLCRNHIDTDAGSRSQGRHPGRSTAMFSRTFLADVLASVRDVCKIQRNNPGR